MSFSTASGRSPCSTAPSPRSNASAPTAGRANHFERLKPWLAGAAAHGDQAAAARTLGLSEGALKVAVHRLRLRFRAFVKAEVAQTLDASDPVEDELQQLFIALGCGAR